MYVLREIFFLNTLWDLYSMEYASVIKTTLIIQRGEIGSRKQQWLAQNPSDTYGRIQIYRVYVVD